MVVKYGYDIPEAVKYPGWAHGLLFVLYLFAILLAKKAMNWNFFKLHIPLIASLLPLGTFFLDPHLKRREIDLKEGRAVISNRTEHYIKTFIWSFLLSILTVICFVIDGTLTTERLIQSLIIGIIVRPYVVFLLASIISYFKRPDDRIERFNNLSIYLMWILTVAEVLRGIVILSS